LRHVAKFDGSSSPSLARRTRSAIANDTENSTAENSTADLGAISVMRGAFTDPAEALCSVLTFFASALAAAAGTGGGGMYVPLLYSLTRLEVKDAVQVSQAMIFASSFINVAVFMPKRHPEASKQPVIDYTCVALLAPLLFLGVNLGVMANAVSPQWLLVALLFLTLAMALWRTAAKGVRQYYAERQRAAEEMPLSSPMVRLASEPSGELERTCWENFMELARSKLWQVILVLVVWATMIFSANHGFKVCTRGYAFFFLQLSAVLVGCTFLAGIRAQQRVLEVRALGGRHAASFDWTARGYLYYPSIALLAGSLGGMLGIGGGMIMSPVLVEVGMHSEAVQATTAVFVFLSSSLASVQFALAGDIHWGYMQWYGLITVLATVIGQVLCDIFVRKQKRYSLITLAISGVIFTSMCFLVYAGVVQLLEDFDGGASMWFDIAQLCHDTGPEIFPPIVLPLHVDNPWHNTVVITSPP